MGKMTPSRTEVVRRIDESDHDVLRLFPRPNYSEDIDDAQHRPLFYCAQSESGARAPLWGAPRIHGELLKLGFDLGRAHLISVRDKSLLVGGIGEFRKNVVGHVGDLADIVFQFLGIDQAHLRVDPHL